MLAFFHLFFQPLAKIARVVCAEHTPPNTHMSKHTECCFNVSLAGSVDCTHARALALAHRFASSDVNSVHTQYTPVGSPSPYVASSKTVGVAAFAASLDATSDSSKYCVYAGYIDSEIRLVELNVEISERFKHQDVCQIECTWRSITFAEYPRRLFAYVLYAHTCTHTHIHTHTYTRTQARNTNAHTCTPTQTHTHTDKEVSRSRHAIYPDKSIA